jgi:hypothetical protein
VNFVRFLTFELARLHLVPNLALLPSHSVLKQPVGRVPEVSSGCKQCIVVVVCGSRWESLSI